MRNNTVVATIMPNLVTFGTLNAVMLELLKYFQPNPTHLDDAGACNLSIHPNINSLLGSHSHPSHLHDNLEYGSHEMGTINSGSSSPSHNDNSSPNTPNDLGSPHSNSIHFPSVLNHSPRKQHGLITSLNPPPLDNYSLSNYNSHNSSIYSSGMHGPLPSPLSLPNPLPSHLHPPGARSGPLHSLPLPRPPHYVCNFIQEMPPIKDYYGVQ